MRHRKLEFKIVESGGKYFLHLDERFLEKLMKDCPDLFYDEDTFAEGIEEELESLVQSEFPLKESGFYIAILDSVDSVELHKYPTSGRLVTRLYHLTDVANRILDEGFKGSTRCREGDVRYSEPRSYFSTVPFSDLGEITDENLWGFEELEVIFETPVLAYPDEECRDVPSYVFVKSEDFGKYSVSRTGFRCAKPEIRGLSFF